MSDETATTMIHVRVPKTLIRRLDILAAYRSMDRAKTVEELLETALDCLERHPQENRSDLAQLVALSR
jgi:hypothetical protein